MNFLDEFGITDSEYQDMLKIYGKSNLEDFKCNINNAYEVSDYLKKIGINNIKNILIEYLDFFKMDIEKVKTIFIRNGIAETVAKVNEDFSILDTLL